MKNVDSVDQRSDWTFKAVWSDLHFPQKLLVLSSVRKELKKKVTEMAVAKLRNMCHTERRKKSTVKTRALKY